MGKRPPNLRDIRPDSQHQHVDHDLNAHKPGTDNSHLVGDLYQHGRSYPRTEHFYDSSHDVDNSHSRRANSPSPETDQVFNKVDVQSPVDRHDPAGNYDNDVPINSWLRNGDATSMPFFDRGNSWRMGREESLDWKKAGVYEDHKVDDGQDELMSARQRQMRRK